MVASSRLALVPLFALGLGAILGAPSAAFAQLTLFYTTNEGGNSPNEPLSDDYFAKSVLENIGDGTGVTITITSNLPTITPGNPFWEQFWFSMNGTNATVTSVGCVFNSTGCLAGNTNVLGANNWSFNPTGLVAGDNPPSNGIDGFSGWELTFELENSNNPAPPDRLSDTRTAVFTVLGTNLTIDDFVAGPVKNGQITPYISCGHLLGLPDSTSVCNGTPDHNTTSVPGPLPLLGAAAAFGYSRKIRTRIQGSRQQATIS
jgi:hypothetical protein